jgi:phage terminase large subunit GpA-like protein
MNMSSNDTNSAAHIWARAAQALRPPPQLPLSDWIEQTIQLQQGLAAEPGPIRLWPWQRAIADAVADNERVTVCKSARVGYTALLDGITGHFCVNDPAAILVLMPTESDARDHVVSNVEATFGASPALRGILGNPGKGEHGRITICHRPFAGGSLRVVAAKAPRNLRRITARVLLIDEC